MKNNEDNYKLNLPDIDYEKVASYCKENYIEEVKEVIETADNICNKNFIFNLNWDMEQTHKVVHFENDIDWEYCPEDDPEWIFALNRHRYWICLGQAYYLTGNDKYAATFVVQLCHWIDNVKLNDTTKNTTWRSIEAGLRMEYWIKAFNYFKDSDYMTADIVEKFTNSLREHGEYLLLKNVPFSTISNWGVIENHGLFEVGIVLFNDEYVEVAKKRLEEEISMQVLDDGVHWEQSPMYHNEVLNCFLDVIYMGQENSVSFTEDFIKKARKMAVVNVSWKKSNHKEFMQGDSDDFDLRDVLTRSGYIFNDGVLKFTGYKKMDFNNVWEFGYKSVEQYEQIKAKEPDFISRSLEATGNHYLRSSWEEDCNLLHFSCGRVGGGHGHCEKLHIDLMANGEDVLMDSGRFTYVDNDIRHKLKGAIGHNTIVVDDTDFMTMTDSWGFSKLAMPVKQKSYISDKYDFIQGGHLGYIHQGVFVNRKIIFIKPDIYVVSDEMYTGDSHKYNQYFHFNNYGKVEINEKKSCISYKGEKSNVVMQFFDNITMGKISTNISRLYNKLEENFTVKTEFSDEKSCFRTFVIDINSVGADSKSIIEKVAVESVGDIIGHNHEMIEAIKIKKNNKEYIVFIAHEETFSNVNLFKTEECNMLGNVVVVEKDGDVSTRTVLNW